MFYFNIIAIFEDKPENHWVQETLHWWNEQLPDLNKPTKKRKQVVLEDKDIDNGSDDNGVVDLRKAMRAYRLCHLLCILTTEALHYLHHLPPTPKATAASSAPLPTASITAIAI
ncbi:hypothetical protein H0H87_008579 [Tephrocybe sp. NHM501043]|nr:hypothetical protein H0H87_008579 [Tephrocybe sp. NHM501043]